MDIIIAGKLLGVPQWSRALAFGGTALLVALQTNFVVFEVRPPSPGGRDEDRNRTSNVW